MEIRQYLILSIEMHAIVSEYMGSSTELRNKMMVALGNDTDKVIRNTASHSFREGGGNREFEGKLHTE